MSARDLIALSVLLAFYLACNRIFREKASAKARYFAGIILMVVFLVPFRVSLVSMRMPEWITQSHIQGTVIPISGKTEISDFLHGGVAEMMTDIPEAAGLFSIRTLWLAVYAIGVCVSLAVALGKYFRFCKTVNRCAGAPSDELLWQMDMLCGKMGICRQPKLIVCHASVANIIGAPFTFGIFRRTVVMPADMEGEDAEILLEHELHHCKQKDTLIRLTMTVLKALYWYYLPIYFFAKAMESVCEEACDERMTDGKNTADRAAYAKLLVRFASARSASAVSFSNSREKLKRRITALFSGNAEREGHWLLLLVVIVAVALRGVEMCATPNFQRQMSGAEYLQTIQSTDTEESDLLRAFEAAGKLDDLEYGIFYELSYMDEPIGEYGIFYKNCLVSVIAVQSEDGTAYEQYEICADETRAKTCVGMRVIYGQNANGEKEYRRIEIMTDEALLRCYAAELLSPADLISSAWKRKLVQTAATKTPDDLDFYRILFNRAQS